MLLNDLRWAGIAALSFIILVIVALAIVSPYVAWRELQDDTEIADYLSGSYPNSLANRERIAEKLRILQEENSKGY